MDVPHKDYPPLAQALMRPDAYPDEVAQVRIEETHVSFLFFTGQRVYKVKKPVDYGFLDFTTLEKRRFYCHQEVALNSRLSPDVYLGVVPICEHEGRYRVEGPGDVVEYAVKMRQLPRERALNELVRRNQVSEADVRRVAARIAAFHASAPTSAEITRLGDLSVVRQNVEENFQQTAPYVGVCLSQDEYDDLAAYSRAFMDVKAEVFARRATEGRIRDGHGDLHAANIFLEACPERSRRNGIHVIDCIEFNDRFRCLDVAEDIAFLAMDLDFYERPDLSNSLMAAYVEASGDPGVMELLDFFKCYRAYVRGKVTSFRLGDLALSNDERQQAQATAQAYFRLARAYTRRVFPRPLLVVMAGLMGTGKTFLSAELSRRWGMEHISSDVTRKLLAGVPPTQRRYEPHGQGIYTPEFSNLTYQTMFRNARHLLARGKSVVLDATFTLRIGRLEAMKIAKETGADLLIVECVLSDEEAERRLVRRWEGREVTASDGRWELYHQQKAGWEPMDEVPPSMYIRLDTGGTREENISGLLRSLFSKQLS
jgi:aminoglycoside phosphotransferase family enzyme/predicted kinase